jgi:oligopeptide/dipeptide ABC transporter ATP-binding protein
MIQPDFVVCDEPLSALDVSIQAQIVNLLEDMQVSLSLTYLFISHDLSVVRHVSDRVAVMYLGKIVEITQSDRLYERPLHPYTQALLASALEADPRRAALQKRGRLAGEIPSSLNPPSGCRFRTRCPIADAYCAQVEPTLEEKEPGHRVACHKVRAADGLGVTTSVPDGGALASAPYRPTANYVAVPSAATTSRSSPRLSSARYAGRPPT